MDCTIAVLKTSEYDVCLWLHTAKDPPAPEWKASLDVMRECKGSGTGARMRSLVVTDGGAPNVTQRAELSELFDGKPYKLAVVTIALTNPIKRGIATAISWINPAFRAVPPSQVQQALTHIDLSGHLPSFLPHFDRLQAQLPPVITLQMLKTNEATRKR